MTLRSSYQTAGPSTINIDFFKACKYLKVKLLEGVVAGVSDTVTLTKMCRSPTPSKNEITQYRTKKSKQCNTRKVHPISH